MKTHLAGQTRVGTFKDVLHLPELSEMLISTTKMSDMGVNTIFTSQHADLVEAHPRNLLACAIRDHNLYRLRVTIHKPEGAHIARNHPTSKATLELWHHRLSHISEDTIQKMVKTEAAVGMTVVGDGSRDCSACQKGKQTRNIILHSTEERATEVLGRVFSDLCGPMETPTIEGYQYFVTFTDDYS